MAKISFGKLADGREASLYTLQNKSGMVVAVSDYGGTLVQIRVPDQDGQMGDVLLGHDSVGEYEAYGVFMACLVGRYANRIAKGRFELDGVEYTLATNNAPNHLHGGPGGFHSKVWHVDAVSDSAITLSISSPDGEEGFPGNVSVQVSYSVTEDNELKISYSATTDRPTVLNMTNHAYFNLAETGTVDDHQITIFADSMTPIDETSIPLGDFMPVDGTPFDLRRPMPIGVGRTADHEQIKIGNGFDHNFVINNRGDGLVPAATVSEPITGRVLEMFTTEPGVQFYTGNFLKSQMGKRGEVYHPYTGFCLEAQKFPDSPNQPQFPSATLRPGEVYEQTTVYKFSVRP
ncbi:MAG: aldose epimerase family protein [Anaerolineae bacterium]